MYPLLPQTFFGAHHRVRIHRHIRLNRPSDVLRRKQRDHRFPKSHSHLRGPPGLHRHYVTHLLPSFVLHLNDLWSHRQRLKHHRRGTGKDPVYKQTRSRRLRGYPEIPPSPQLRHDALLLSTVKIKRLLPIRIVWLFHLDPMRTHFYLGPKWRIPPNRPVHVHPGSRGDRIHRQLRHRTAMPLGSPVFPDRYRSHRHSPIISRKPPISDPSLHVPLFIDNRHPIGETSDHPLRSIPRPSHHPRMADSFLAQISDRAHLAPIRTHRKYPPSGAHKRNLPPERPIHRYDPLPVHPMQRGHLALQIHHLQPTVSPPVHRVGDSSTCSIERRTPDLRAPLTTHEALTSFQSRSYFLHRQLHPSVLYSAHPRDPLSIRRKHSRPQRLRPTDLPIIPVLSHPFPRQSRFHHHLALLRTLLHRNHTQQPSSIPRTTHTRNHRPPIPQCAHLPDMLSSKVHRIDPSRISLLRKKQNLPFGCPWPLVYPSAQTHKSRNKDYTPTHFSIPPEIVIGHCCDSNDLIYKK